MHEPCDSVFHRAQHWRHPQRGAAQWQGQARLRRRLPALFFRADQIVTRNAPPNFSPVDEFSCAARRAGRLDNVNVPSGEL